MVGEDHQRLMKSKEIPHKTREQLESRLLDALDGALDATELAELERAIQRFPDLVEQWKHVNTAPIPVLPDRVFMLDSTNQELQLRIAKRMDQEVFWMSFVPELKQMLWKVSVPAMAVAASILLFFQSPRQGSMADEMAIEELSNWLQADMVKTEDSFSGDLPVIEALIEAVQVDAQTLEGAQENE